MTSITLSFFGPPEQKHVCKVTAMQTLADALQAASTKFKPPLQPDQCELLYNKKPVDMRTPFRLLNVPAGSRLEILKKEAAPGASPAARPAATAPAAASSSVAPAAATEAPPAAAAEPPEAEPPVTAAQPASAAQTRQVPTSEGQQPAPAVAPAAAAAAGAAPEPTAAGTSAGGPLAVAAGCSGAATTSSAAAAPAAAAAPSSQAAVNPALAALGVTVPVFVFHQRVLEAAATQAPSAMDIDPPDEFFEMTAEDLQRLQQQANQKKKAESIFRSRAAREAEEAARAASLGPVRVRLHFPDGTLLQAAFKATDPLSQVQDLLRKCAAPQLGPALYLYTTPPKTVLKDAAATLYSLQLVPAAHLYVGVDEKKAQAAGASPGPFLRPEVQALMQETVPESQPAAQQEQQQDHTGVADSAEAVAAAQRAVRLAAAASRQGAASGSAAGGTKVPKWFKK